MKFGQKCQSKISLKSENYVMNWSGEGNGKLGEGRNVGDKGGKGRS